MEHPDTIGFSRLLVLTPKKKKSAFVANEQIYSQLTSQHLQNRARSCIHANGEGILNYCAIDFTATFRSSFFCSNYMFQISIHRVVQLCKKTIKGKVR